MKISRRGWRCPLTEPSEACRCILVVLLRRGRGLDCKTRLKRLRLHGQGNLDRSLAPLRQDTLLNDNVDRPAGHDEMLDTIAMNQN